MIKAVIFDIDGVLIDSLKGNAMLFRDIFRLAGYKKLPTVAHYKKHFHFPAIGYFRIFAKNSDEKEITRLMKLLYENRRNHPLKIMPGSLKVIKQMSKKYKLALVTSRTRGGVEHYLETSLAHGHFAATVHLGMYQNPKPHPEPLLLACKRLKVKPEHAVYVGDAHTDIEAAKAAGMKAILFPKRRIPGADAYAKEISEIPKIVKEM